MLRILNVNPTGFGPYGMHEDVPVDACGVVWLTGDNRDRGGSNASGKSWFFNTIAYCLWGRVETVIGGSFVVSDDVSNAVMGIGSCPRVVFVAPDGQIWRVTCSRKWKAPKSNPSPYLNDSPLWPFKGSDVFLERWDAATSTWIDERKSTAPLTRNRLRDIVGVTYERYLVTTYLAQGKGLNFLSGKHADRMDIFTDVANLSFWDTVAATFKYKLSEVHQSEKDTEAKFNRLQGELAATKILSDEQLLQCRNGIATAKIEIDRLSAEKKELDAQVLELSKQIGSLQQGANPYDAAIREHDFRARTVMQSWHEKARAAATEVQRQREATNAAVASLQAQTSAEVHAITSKLRVAEVARDKAARAVDDFLSGKLTHCPTCKQELPNKVDGSALQADLDNCKVECESLQALLQEEQQTFHAAKSLRMEGLQEDGQEAAAQLEASLAATEKQLLDAQAALDRERDDLVGKKQAFDASEASKNEAVAHLIMKQNEVLGRASGLRGQIDAHQRNLTSYEHSLKTDEVARTRRVELEADVKSTGDELALLRRDVAEWSWLTKHVGDKGLKAYKLEEICQRLNELLADALADIDGGFRLWVKPYRVRPGVKKDESELLAEDVINEITIYAQEGHKTAVPLHLYSGGEASIVALAFLVALWQLADENGSGTNLLLLDEVVGFLDAKNSQIVVRFLESLKTAGKTVIAVSHSQVVDSVTFDAVWTATKENGVSRLVRA